MTWKLGIVTTSYSQVAFDRKYAAFPNQRNQLGDEDLIAVGFLHLIRLKTSLEERVTSATPVLAVPVRLLDSGYSEKLLRAERITTIGCGSAPNLIQDMLLVHFDSL